MVPLCGTLESFPLLGNRFDRRAAFDDPVVETPVRMIDGDQRFHELEKTKYDF